MSTTYKVEIEFATKGDLGGKMGDATKKIGEAHGKFSEAGQAAVKFADTLNGIGGKIMGPIDAVVSKVAGLGIAFAKVGGATAVGAAVYGVTVLNNELEKTQISLAAIFNANGAANGMADGMTLAADQLSKMRRDAAELPGEFQDLANIMRTTAVPGLKAGMSVDNLRSMSANLMAAGAVTGIPMDQVAREAAMLMEGRAGAHNVLGMRLAGLSGDKAAKFNQSSSADRLKTINEELTKFAPAIEVYKNSFEGISSTLIDNAKQFLGAATMPLFERVKTSMSGMNKWMDDHEGKWKSIAKIIGSDLARAYDWVEKTASEVLPKALGFVDELYTRVRGAWEYIGPIAEKAGEVFKNFLGDPAAIDKIIHAFKMYGELKIGGSVAGSALSGGASLFSTAMGLGARAVSSGGGGAGAGVGAAALSGAAGDASIYMAAAAGPAIVGLIGAAGAMHAVTDESSIFHDVASKQWKELSSKWDIFTDRMSIAGNGALAALYPVVDTLGTGLLYAANSAVWALDKVGWALEHTIGKLAHAKGIRDGEGDYSEEELADFNKPIRDTRTVAERAAATEFQKMVHEGTQGLTGGKDPIGDAIRKAKDGSARHPGGAGTNIQKVEIVVTSNQDPSRIARVVMDRIQNLKRNPRISPFVDNWSGNPGTT